MILYLFAHNDSLEVLLTSADYQALSIKLLGSVSSLYIGNFLICYDNTTLFYSTSCFTAGCRQTGFYQNTENIDLTIHKISLCQLAGRHFCSIATGKQCSCTLLCLLSLFLAMYQIGQFVCQNLLRLIQLAAFPLSISSICSKGRKVSIRRHFRTSASATFLQYW